MIQKMTLRHILSEESYQAICDRLDTSTAAKSTKYSHIFSYQKGSVYKLAMM